MNNNNNKIAYHFVGDTLRDGRPVPADGEWLEHAGDIELCERGLHWSAEPFDALQYATGNILCMVEYDGETVVGDDKGVSRRRRIIKRVNAESLLREFARWAALQVIDQWDAPDIVRQYLITGDEKIREAARDAIGDAAWATTGAAERDARAAAWATTWAAERDAWATTWAAAWGTAWDTARAAQRARFAEMVNAAFEEIEMKKMPEELGEKSMTPTITPEALDYTPGELDRTAPERIWLQIDTAGDNEDRGEQWPGSEHVTWQEESIGGLEVQYVRADLAALPELQAAQPSIIEQIAQQWDGCNFDPMGETIDIGDAIRRAGKRLQTEALSHPPAHAAVPVDAPKLPDSIEVALKMYADRLTEWETWDTKKREALNTSWRESGHQYCHTDNDGHAVYIASESWAENALQDLEEWKRLIATHPQPAAPDSQPVGDDGQPMVLVSREFRIQAEHDTQIASDVANLLRDNKFGLRGSQPEMVAALLKIAARQPVGQEPVAWISEHAVARWAADPRSLHIKGLTKRSDSAGCTVPLYAAPPAPAAVPVDVQRDATRYRHLRELPDEHTEGLDVALWVDDLGEPIRGAALDAAIDAAMAAQPQGEGVGRG